MTRITRMFCLLLCLGLLGCGTIKKITEEQLSTDYLDRLSEVEAEMLAGSTTEVEIDRKIAEAVKQMVATLKPEYRKQGILGKHKLGFLEISDIDRQEVNKMHNYVTEKTLTFSFLQPIIAQSFNLVERFLLKDVLRELHLENFTSPAVIDQTLAKELGRIYDVDIIETGVVTVSDAFVDINLRMVETRRGRIVAVGSVKLDNNETTRHWLEEVGGVGVGWPVKE